MPIISSLLFCGTPASERPRFATFGLFLSTHRITLLFRRLVAECSDCRVKKRDGSPIEGCDLDNISEVERAISEPDCTQAKSLIAAFLHPLPPWLRTEDFPIRLT